MDKETFSRLLKQRGDCLEWAGSVNQSGYGKVMVEGKTVYAHRFAYQNAKGEIPKGLVVRHTCDNRRCCNPDHLILGTQQQNVADMKERGREAPFPFWRNKE